MFRTLNFTTQVPLDHELRIKLPANVPTGPADIVMVVSPRNGRKPKTVSRSAIRKAFGMWKDRVIASRSLDFAQQLRQAAWSRSTE